MRLDSIAMNNDNSSALNKQLVILLSKCARSDEVALKDVYKLTSAKLFSVIVRTLGMNAEAEKALQETYVNVWLQAGNYRADLREPMTWLTSIARKHASDVLQGQREQEGQGVTLPVAKLNHTELAELQFLDKSEHAQNLETELNRLDEQPRDCIVRAYAESSSLKELSELHDAPPATVKTWIQRGLVSLKGGAHGIS